MIKYVLRFRRRQHTTRLPYYDLVIMKKSSRMRGAVLARVGFVHYHGNKKLVAVDIEEVSKWLLRDIEVKFKVAKFISLLFNDIL